MARAILGIDASDNSSSEIVAELGNDHDSLNRKANPASEIRSGSNWESLTFCNHTRSNS
jgi:hypothetical protein